MNTEQQADVENRYKSFFESIDQGYFEVDLCGNLTFSNDALCNILMVSREEIMGMNNRQYMDRANAKDIFQIFKKVFRTGKSEIGIMFEIIRKDKCKRKIGSAVSLMRDADDLPIGFRGTVRGSDPGRHRPKTPDFQAKGMKLGHLYNVLIVNNRERTSAKKTLPPLRHYRSGWT